MKFGIGPIMSQKLPSDERSLNEVYEDSIDLLVTAEILGFDSCWFAEHHFVPDGHVSSPLSFAAATAGRTTDIRIGTAILLAPFYNPIRLAESVGTIDQLSSGRFTLGLGMGYRDAEFDGYGIDKRSRVARLVETVEILRESWSPGALSYEGSVYEYDDVNVTPTPVQSPSPPIWIGGVSEPAIKRSARLGEATLISPLHPLEGVTERVEWISAAEETTDPNFALMRRCFVGDDAWETVRDSIEYMEQQHFEWDNMDWDPSHLSKIKERGFFGTPTEVAEEIDNFRNELGGDFHLICRLNYPGVLPEKIERSMKLFADEVIPAL